MRRLRRKQDDQEDFGRWLLTYADMITLLLALFIVMYSMSRVDAKRFGKMAEALNGILKGGHSMLKNHGEEQFKTGHGVLKLGDLRMIQRQVEEQFKTKERGEEVLTEVTERGLVVHIVESALFDVASADLQPRAMELLDLIYEEIKDTPNHIRVEGHTDDLQINTARFPSNWELSGARATEVVRYFIDEHDMPPGRISALGYGEYRPIRPNNSIENRATNRRVDIVVLTRELSLTEPSAQLYGQTDQ
ncbi:MAG: flagellar motor protein MotB [candidate division Zixibacteria bacterium]|nr:flagellar motor protein MotB [candidate division Zixibacteria bacterium]